jgi:hypothetical protein
MFISVCVYVVFVCAQCFDFLPWYPLDTVTNAPWHRAGPLPSPRVAGRTQLAVGTITQQYILSDLMVKMIAHL